MNHVQRLASVLVLAAGLAAPALAQTPPAAASPEAHHRMTPEQRAARFDKADANHDGKLTKAEFTASLKPERAANADRMWSRLNPTGKDSIAKADFLAAPMGHKPPAK